MMRIQKPFNIVWEVFVFMLLLGSFATIGRYVEAPVLAKAWLVLALVVFCASVLRITRRAVRLGLESRLNASAFSFGFLCGSAVWLLYVLSELKSGRILVLLGALFFVALVGVIAGGMAVLCASGIRGLLGARRNE